jgi:demethylmenaquinone methyltransferase/2-methoxy-6-polyprenyl-1,4-benzoquinol methylase
MFDRIAPRYDFLNRLLTFGLDIGWRRKTVASLRLDPGDLIADMACGTGDLCRDLQRAGYRALGIDISWGMLANTRSDTPLIQGDALSAALPDRSVSGVTCGFALRNLEALPPFFAEVARVLTPGGRMAVLEVDLPNNPGLRFGHGFYFGRVVPWIGALLSDRDAYRYLPRSVAYLPDQTQLLALIAKAGFTEVEKTSLTGGIAQLITATRL